MSAYPLHYIKAFAFYTILTRSELVLVTTQIFDH